jgi:hypothetical protein
MEYYRRTQTGRGLVLLLLVTFLAVGMIILAPHLAPKETLDAMTPDKALPPANAVAPLAILLAATLLFTSQTVAVTEDALCIVLLRGLYTRRIPLAEIAESRPTRIPWYTVGVKSVRKGWLYSVAPGDGVELLLRNGRRLVVGTGDLQGLVAALRERSRALPQHEIRSGA